MHTNINLHGATKVKLELKVMEDDYDVLKIVITDFEGSETAINIFSDSTSLELENINV